MTVQFKHLEKGSTVGSGSYVFRKYAEASPTPQLEPFLTFSSPSSFTLEVVNNIKYWDGTLQYSINKTNWTTWAGTSAISSASDGTKHNIYVRGAGNTYITGTNVNTNLTRAVWRLNGSNISIKGSIETLLDYATVELGNHPAMATDCYKQLFAYTNTSPNSNIVDISGLILSAQTLTANCYYGLFQNNSGITNLPQINANVLAAACFYRMFYGCSSILSIPNNYLPITTLAGYCYYGMFQNCSSLTSIPTGLLPATTLEEACYLNMFRATGITSIPTGLLPATTLQVKCYYCMFYNCTNLTSIPNNLLPATTMFNECYTAMFRGCTSLTNVCALPATTLADYCYNLMFTVCTNLISIPALPALTIDGYSCYQDMFNGCSKIKLSTTQVDDYTNEYRIPINGTGSVTGPYALNDMFTGTGGTFTGRPSINTTYYTSNAIVNTDGTITPAAS